MKQFWKEWTFEYSIPNFSTWNISEEDSKLVLINQLCGRLTILHLLVNIFYSLWCLTISLTENHTSFYFFIAKTEVSLGFRYFEFLITRAQIPNSNICIFVLAQVAVCCKHLENVCNIVSISVRNNSRLDNFQPITLINRS